MKCPERGGEVLGERRGVEKVRREGEWRWVGRVWEDGV